MHYVPIMGIKYKPKKETNKKRLTKKAKPPNKHTR